MNRIARGDFPSFICVNLRHLRFYGFYPEIIEPGWAARASEKRGNLRRA
jgi:hypothetical protein